MTAADMCPHAPQASACHPPPPRVHIAPPPAMADSRYAALEAMRGAATIAARQSSAAHSQRDSPESAPVQLPALSGAPFPPMLRGASAPTTPSPGAAHASFDLLTSELGLEGLHGPLTPPHYLYRASSPEKMGAGGPGGGNLTNGGGPPKFADL